MNNAASPSLNSSLLFLAILYNRLERVIDLPPFDGEAIICTELDSNSYDKVLSFRPFLFVYGLFTGRGFSNSAAGF